MFLIGSLSLCEGWNINPAALCDNTGGIYCDSGSTRVIPTCWSMAGWAFPSRLNFAGLWSWISPYSAGISCVVFLSVALILGLFRIAIFVSKTQFTPLLKVVGGFLPWLVCCFFSRLEVEYRKLGYVHYLKSGWLTDTFCQVFEVHISVNIKTFPLHKCWLEQIALLRSMNNEARYPPCLWSPKLE